ncbi:MAG: hypothetical protein JWN34_1157 [Bryobacterales bacterium]|nr:hypothetical protein [Bryobacterales bacterium]
MYGRFRLLHKLADEFRDDPVVDQTADSIVRKYHFGLHHEARTVGSVLFHRITKLCSAYNLQQGSGRPRKILAIHSPERNKFIYVVCPANWPRTPGRAGGRVPMPAGPRHVVPLLPGTDSSISNLPTGPMASSQVAYARLLRGDVSLSAAGVLIFLARR